LLSSLAMRTLTRRTYNFLCPHVAEASTVLHLEEPGDTTVDRRQEIGRRANIWHHV
jgi:hypothetical protein